jgi:hypothetical protein
MDEINKDEVECAKSYRDIFHSEKNFAQRRGSELADEFTRLEVQIAAIIIAFGGAFLTFFNEYEFTTPGLTFLMKIFYASSILSLILSLVLGLIHIKRKEKFWDEVMNQKHIATKKWIETTQGKVTFKEAKAYQDGTALERGNIIYSPLWTWVLQTAFLGVAFVLFFILFLVLLFV